MRGFRPIWVNLKISTTNVPKRGKVMFSHVFVKQFLIDGDREQWNRQFITNTPFPTCTWHMGTTAAPPNTELCASRWYASYCNGVLSNICLRQGNEAIKHKYKITKLNFSNKICKLFHIIFNYFQYCASFISTTARAPKPLLPRIPKGQWPLCWLIFWSPHILQLKWS